MTDHVKITRALISVSDKTGLAEFGQFLASQGVEVLSTGGTARTLRDAGVDVVTVARAAGVRAGELPRGRSAPRRGNLLRSVDDR